jgi:hypothetical protein
VASPLALLLLVLAVGGATAHHNSHLSGATVSPRHVEVGGTVALAVTYADDSGAAPTAVTVAVGRTSYPMTAESTAFKTGVRYEASVAPGVGWHAVAFTATDATGDKETVWSGYVEVKGADAPKSSAEPTPVRTSPPTPEPIVTATPVPTPVVGKGGGGTGKSGGGGDEGPGGPGATPVDGGSSPPTPGTTPAPEAPGDTATPNPGGAGQTGEHPAAAPTIAPAAGGLGGESELAVRSGAEASGNVVGRAVEQTQGVVAGGVELARFDLLASYRHASLPMLLQELAPTIATATTGGAAWAAFVIFGKRRRDGDESEPDPRLATAAATALDTGAAHGLRVVDESELPRWRRPSLQQVRRADPLRAVAEAPTMSFAKTGAHPLDSFERRQIRYRLVRLLDCPDEVRAAEIGILDRGDEVQLLERYRVYWRVLCPDGRTGWVHRMTLSEPASRSAPEMVDAVEPACEPSSEAVLEPAYEAEEPVEASAAAPEENVDGFLEAYLRARSDVLRSVDRIEPVELAAVPVESEAAAVESAAVPVAEAAAVESAAVPVAEAVAEAACAIEPAPAVGPSVAALARDYLERAGFAVQGPELSAQPAGETEAATAPADEPWSGAAPAAEPEHADGRYSGHRSGGSRKASNASRLGTRSRHPSR